MENIVYLGKEYISGVSDSFGAQEHRHPMLEVYAACDGCSHVWLDGQEVAGSIVLLGTDTLHAIVDTGKRGIAVFLDPLQPLGCALRARYLMGSSFAPFDRPQTTALLAPLLDGPAEDDVRRASDGLLRMLEAEPMEPPFSEPVLEVVRVLQEDGATYDMDALAEHACLSKSRLAHVFSEQTGISLKEYLQLKRLESACRKMVEGSSVTRAAMDTGFSSSSHIAWSSMRFTGMQLRRMLGL